MDNKSYVGKICPCNNLQTFFNIIFFAIIMSAVFNWHIAIGVMSVLLFVVLIDGQIKNNNVEINSEKDFFSFPSACKYSLFKNIVGLFFPLFQSTGYTKIKLSELRKFCCFQVGKKSFIELYLPENEITILRISDEKDARKLIDELQNVKPDLLHDEFHSNQVYSAKSWRQIFIIIALLISFDIFSPVDMVTEKITPYLLRRQIKVALALRQNSGVVDKAQWLPDAITDISKFKDHYIATVRFKKDDRIKIVKIQTAGLYADLTGKDWQCFLIQQVCEKDLCNFLKNNSKASSKLIDFSVVHLSGNKYVGIAKISVNSKTHEIYLSIEEFDKHIKWQPLGASSLLKLLTI